MKSPMTKGILLSDIFPTGYFGADLAAIEPGNSVAAFGCGPVGQFAITSAWMLGAGRVFAIDRIPGRLERAQAQGAEIVNFDEVEPVAELMRLTNGQDVDRVIDAVGVDAMRPQTGPAQAEGKAQAKQFDGEVKQIAPEQHADGANWRPGDGPSQVLTWAVSALRKAGTLAIIGVFRRDGADVSDRRRDEQKSQPAQRQLQSPQVSVGCGIVGEDGPVKPRAAAHSARTGQRRERSVRGI
jgi:threonine dehydrogenase-like Zn-dependent dehydrogenase